MYRRNIENSVRAALTDTPVVLLNGARQTGKSTLAIKLAKSIPAEYITLDDATALSAAAFDPVGFSQNLSGTTVIDEVQKAPALFPAIKVLVDNDRRPGRFLLTGSANVMMLPKLSESLAGRMEMITLWPLSQGELHERKEGFIEKVFLQNLPSLKKTSSEDRNLIPRIITGGYPEIVQRVSPQRRRAWYASYITTLLQRDVRDLSNIEGLTDMPRLLTLLAGRVGGLLNMSELSRASGIPNTTLKRYLTLLETTYLLQPLPAWSRNLGKRLVKSPKIYLIDSGMVTHLTGQTVERLEQDPTFLGHLLETFVVNELRKQATWSDMQVSLFYLRTTTGKEVDLVLEDNQGRVVGIEVKASGSVQKKDFAGMDALTEACGTKFLRGIVLYGGDKVIPFGEKYYAMPVSAIWRM
jgi:predicted AAA+ superfamily ATPase